MRTRLASAARHASLALVLWLTFAGAASAQQAAGRAEFDEAARQFEAGNHQLALDGFLRTHEIMVQAGNENAPLLWFNIARAQEELGRDAAALESFERFLSESGADAPYRQETADRVRELRARIAADGTEPTAAPAGESPLPVVGWITLGVGAALALAAVPTGLLVLDGEAQLADACPGGACPSSEAALLDDTNGLAVVTDVLWATGVSIAVVGAVLILVGELTGSSESASAGLTPTMTCELTGCVAGVGGVF